MDLKVQSLDCMTVSRVSHSVGVTPPPSKLIPQWGAPHLKMKPPIWKINSPYWKVRSPSRKWFLEKNKKNWKLLLIYTCVSIIKQHWKKMGEIPQECDFLTWSIQNIVKKVKQFVRKYYITWLITRLVVFDIATLTVLFCNCPLFSNCPLTNL